MAETQQLTWTPGNGTVYDILLTKTDATFQGHAAGTFVATISNPGGPVVMFLNPDADLLIYSYVMEKTGLNEHDASCVTEMLAAAMGRRGAVTKAEWYKLGIKNPYTAP